MRCLSSPLSLVLEFFLQVILYISMGNSGKTRQNKTKENNNNGNKIRPHKAFKKIKILKVLKISRSCFPFRPFLSSFSLFAPLPRGSWPWQTLDILLRDHKKWVSYTTETRSSRKTTRFLLNNLICPGTFSYLHAPNPISPICLYLGKQRIWGLQFSLHNATTIGWQKSRSQPWIIFLYFLFNDLTT